MRTRTPGAKKMRGVGTTREPIPMARRRVAAVVHTLSSACLCHEAAARALRSLGWQVLLVPVEDLPAALNVLAAADVVLEHSDTVRGEGWLRAAVRAEAERVGARVAGAASAAAGLCDDKGATAEVLARAGVPVPRTAVLRLPGERVPARLRPPLIVKAAHEHGSLELSEAATREEAEAAGGALLARGSPAVVQERIDGREIAVGFLGRPLRALPPVEVLLGPPGPDGAAPLYTRERKWHRHAEGEPCARVVPADLAPAARRRVLDAARRAARVLGLREYGRVDLRLDRRGRPFVLEANARPSLEEGMELARAAEAAGLTHTALVGAIAAAALTRPRR